LSDFLLHIVTDVFVSLNLNQNPVVVAWWLLLVGLGCFFITNSSVLNNPLSSASFKGIVDNHH